MSDFQIQPEKKGLTEYLSAKSMLVLLLLFVFTGIILGTFASWLVFYLGGISLADLLALPPEQLTASHRNLIRLATLLNHPLTFLLPAWFFARTLEKPHHVRWLQLQTPPAPRTLLLAALLILGAFPLTQFIFWLNRQMPLPYLLEQWETTSETAIRGLIVMESVPEFLFSLFVMALLPALGEELLFRGVLQKILTRVFASHHLAIWGTAIAFSAFHFQFMGFLPRLFLGLILGYLLWWTKNLWVPVFAHLIYNGVQVAAAWAFADKINEIGAPPDEPPALGIIAFSLIFVAASARLIWAQNRGQSAG
ncbi:MAG: CPBP family intramembrane metalloprotease [Bacteroidetes bacterium]|nr:MAG: CPBP family intramembrane metalloprotease [Bacteroidota bacterium]